MKTFEQYLQEIHDKDYHGSGDMAGDAFEAWVERLDVAEVMEYAEKAIVAIQAEEDEKWRTSVRLALGKLVVPNDADRGQKMKIGNIYQPQ